MFFTSDSNAVEVRCPRSLAWDKESNLVLGTSASGFVRASYFGGARTLRRFTISHSALAPQEAAKIEALTHLGYGVELGFIPTGADRANLLTPGASILSTAANVMPRSMTVDKEGMAYVGGVNTAETKRVATDTPFTYPGRKVAIHSVTIKEWASR